MDMLIRSEVLSDAAQIAAVTREAFLVAPYSSHTEEFIIDALRRGGQLAVSLVAEVDGMVVGHVAASPVTVSDGTAGWYGLGPLAVLPGYQGAGVGSALVESALAALRGVGAAGCVLLGEPQYYGRFGFRAEASLLLPEVPPEYFQALSFSGVIPRGTVSYHEAFDARG